MLALSLCQFLYNLTCLLWAFGTGFYIAYFYKSIKKR
jgi:hypothetical protein